MKRAWGSRGEHAAARALPFLLLGQALRTSAIRMSGGTLGSLQTASLVHQDPSNLTDLNQVSGFLCEAYHVYCERDVRLFPDIPVKSSKPLDYNARLVTCKNTGRAVARSKSARSKLVFQHIPKNAGKAVESFLELEFQGHRAMRRKHPYPEGQPYLVVLRHPIERIVSWYYFLKAGKAQHSYKARQAHFCQSGTGVEYGKECIPKYSVAEFLLKGDSKYERAYLGIPSGPMGPTEPIGTDANFMYEWLKPTNTSKLSDVKDFLLKKFALIGDTARLPDFLSQAAILKGYAKDAAASRVRKMSQKHVNPTSHASVMSLLTDKEYEQAAMRHKKDIELY